MFTTKFFDVFSGKMVEFKTKPKVRAPEPSLHRLGITVLADGRMAYEHFELGPGDDKPKTTPPQSALVEQPKEAGYLYWMEGDPCPPKGWYWAYRKEENKDKVIRWTDGSGRWTRAWKFNLTGLEMRGLMHESNLRHCKEMNYIECEFNVNSDSIRPRKGSIKGV